MRFKSVTFDLDGTLLDTVADLAEACRLMLAELEAPPRSEAEIRRFVGRGMSKQSAVLVIWGLTACTGIAGIFLGSLEAWKAALVGIQVVMALVVLAAFEHATGWRGLSSAPPREHDESNQEHRRD